MMYTDVRLLMNMCPALLRLTSWLTRDLHLPAAIPALAALLVCGNWLPANGQSVVEATLLSQLRQVFPSAAVFSPKSGEPPRFTAYRTDPKVDAETPLGLVFWTTELDPLERGYDGPIKILVGMDMKGVLAGILVVSHREPYGEFSVDRPEFAAQFKGKSVRDPFRLGEDIDAVSRATITMGSATRAVRNSARRIARQLLSPSGMFLAP